MGKKAAAPAGEKEKKVVEDKKVEEKGKPQQQPQQTQQKGKGKGAKQQEEVVEEQKTQKEETGKKDIKDRELDQEEKVIYARIEKIDDEIRAHRAEIDKIQEDIDAKKNSNKKLQEEQKELWGESAKQGDSKEFSNQFLKKKDQIQEQQKLKKAKMDEQKKLKDQMGHSVKEKDYLKNLEAEIRGLQDKQQSGNVGNIHEEKKLIAEISKLTTNKKLFKSYAELNEIIAQYETTISALRVELGKIDEEHKALKDKKKVFDDQALAKRAEHDSTSKQIDDAYTEKKRLVAEVKNMEERKDNVYNQLRAYRTDRREKAQKKREDEQKKRKEEKEAAEQKRQQEEETKGFYAEEIDACTQLLSYLEPFKYTPPAPEAEESEEKGEKEEKEGEKENEEGSSSSTPAPAAEEKPKRGGKKKPTGETDKEKELKHAAQTFFQFELLSLVAPVKVGDVEATIGQINEKKVYLEKKQEERKERKAN